MQATLAGLLVVLVAGTAACAPVTESSPPMPRDTQSQAAASRTSSSFNAWREGFRPRALNAGIRPQTFDTAFAGVGINADVVRLDGRQAEFTKPIWEYLDTAVSDTRIENGRANQAEWSRTLTAIEARYGVEKEIVVAVWGMETNYGGFRGNISTIEALATLAHEGRRRAFAEEQLIAALRILQAGDVAPSAMRGSWAGAMGHTQFIPTSYLAYAQDFNGDGRRDVWAEDPTDALASTAAYLAQFGWTKGQPWGVEVRLPQGFDYAVIDQNNRRAVGDWTAAGVRGLDGAPVRDYGPAALLAPAGARGPVFLVFNNFRVIKRYNNATSYAMGVGHLGARIAGAADFTAAWPRGDRALSRSEKSEMQNRLTALGFDTGGADGVIGPNTEAAIRQFQRSRGLVPDGYASASLLQQLRGG